MNREQLERMAAADASWETVWKPLLNAVKEDVVKEIAKEEDPDTVRRLQGSLMTIENMLSMPETVKSKEEREVKGVRKLYRWRY